MYMYVYILFLSSYEKRRGLDIGPTFVLIHAQPIMGRKYVYLKDGRVTVDKMWQPTSAPYVLQACVRNNKMLEVRFITQLYHIQKGFARTKVVFC